MITEDIIKETYIQRIVKRTKTILHKLVNGIEHKGIFFVFGIAVVTLWFSDIAVRVP